MPVKLTPTAIKAAAETCELTGTRRDLSDPDCPGLRLRLSSNDKASWSWALACRDRLGRMRRFRLGSYQDMGLAEARSAARALRVQVAAGADPTAERRRERALGAAARAGTGTLAAVLDLYGEKDGRLLKSWPESRKRVALVFRSLLPRPASALTIGDVQMAVDGYPSAASAAFAVRTLRPVLKWAAEPGRAYVSPALVAVRSPVTTTRRVRVLTRDELAALLPVLRASTRPYALALLFVLLTLARREEAASARWRDVDLAAGTWTIPEPKNKVAHAGTERHTRSET